MIDEPHIIDDATIAAYLDGALPPSEVARVERAMAGDAQLAETLGGMGRILKAPVKYPEWDTQQLWHSFAERSGLGDRAQVVSSKPDYKIFADPAYRSNDRGVKPVPWNVWYTLAGVVAALVAIVAGLQTNIVHMFRPSTHTESTYTTYTTTNGERATITLADGNTVALNVASRLEVPTNYGSGNRVVRLPAGEALFTVSHHVGTPFTVVAGPATARVLGTSFIVRHYGTDTTATVAVNEGKVAVGSVVVAARQLVEVGERGVSRVGPADASLFTFSAGVLTFDDVPLSAAIGQLDRWYNVDIRIEDPSLASRRLKGKFAAGSLADLSAILELTFNARAVRDGRVLHLYPGR